ncbi:uncharacterized protein [Populus alba]|nr:uncharacterized protein LOC118037224 isoform X1 [Populus alba]KAJ7002568.1 hypothetical protein NC653_007918 [Populus alba x Populus x berolinensis]
MSSGGSKMTRNLVRGNSSSVQDVQDPIVAGSAGPQRRKSTQDINKDRLAKMIEKKKKSKARMKNLEKGYFQLEGQASQVTMDLKETREKYIEVLIGQKSHTDSILELQKLVASGGEKMSALKEEHAQEIHALKAKHAQELLERDRKFNALKAKHAQELLERDRKFNALKEEHEVCAPWGAEVEMCLGTPEI